MFPESIPPNRPFFFGAAGCTGTCTATVLGAGPFRTVVVVVVDPFFDLVTTVVLTLVPGVAPGVFLAAGRAGRAGRPVVAGGPSVLFDGGCWITRRGGCAFGGALTDELEPEAFEVVGRGARRTGVGSPPLPVVEADGAFLGVPAAARSARLACLMARRASTTVEVAGVVAGLGAAGLLSAGEGAVPLVALGRTRDGRSRGVRLERSDDEYAFCLFRS